MAIDDNNITMSRFQNMLSYYQHRCSLEANNKSNSKYWMSTDAAGGIGYTILTAGANILRAFELGNIFKPAGSWIWGDDQHCFNASKSTDCFNLPLTYCKSVPNDQIASLVTFDRNDALDLIPKPCDVCNLAKLVKKSMMWVYGQVLHYHIRLPPALERKIQARIQPIFPNLVNTTRDHRVIQKVDRISYRDPQTGLRCVTAAIHIRSGDPDISRIPLNGTEHLQVLHEYNVRLRAQNVTICDVYVGSDHIEDTIFFPKDLLGKSRVGGFSPAIVHRKDSFVFKTLPRYIMAPGEIEYQIQAIKTSGNITMEYLYQEFMEDALLYSHADIFIGAFSNMFGLVSALRQAYYPQLPNNATCFFNTRKSVMSLNCMNSQGALSLFRYENGGWDGGAMFFSGR